MKLHPHIFLWLLCRINLFLKPLNLLKKRSLQSCNSAVIKAFNILHMGILS